MKKRNHADILSVITFALLGFSCHRHPLAVDEVLKKAGNNKTELLKVIDHYREVGDNEKLTAAYFLIENMENKVGHSGDFVDNFFPVFETLHKLTERDVNGDTINKIIKAQWDSLESQKGEINDLNYPLEYDYRSIRSSFLIENIDMAFKAWRERPWAKHVNFDNFCEFILPYRVFDEPIQFNRKQIFQDFSWLEDSLKDKSDPKEACLVVNRYVSKRFVFSYMLDKCPVLSVKNTLTLYGGVCLHRYLLTASIMRSLGIPVAIDLSAQYNDIPGSHYWLSVLDRGNIFRPFNGGDQVLFGKYPSSELFPDSIFAPVGNGKSTKVYRVNFGQTEGLNYRKPRANSLPPFLLDENLVDVTNQYDFPKTSVQIKLNISPPQSCDVVTLCSFGLSDDLIPIDYTIPSANVADFANVGRSAVYIAAYYVNDQYIVASEPYYYREKGGLEILKPNLGKFETINLVRKYPEFDTSFAKMMVGAKFQAANNAAFIGAKTLYTIDSPYMYYAEKNIHCHERFRYYRYMPSEKKEVHIAEISFMRDGDTYTSNQNKRYRVFGKSVNDTFAGTETFRNAFDGDVSTNFNAPPKSWVAIDFGKATNIAKIRFCVRNDLNVIEIGHTYELFYFDMGWISLGRKIAQRNNIVFDHVPKNALLLLRDRTKGNQERIFMYRNGKQIWL